MCVSHPLSRREAHPAPFTYLKKVYQISLVFEIFKNLSYHFYELNAVRGIQFIIILRMMFGHREQTF